MLNDLASGDGAAAGDHAVMADIGARDAWPVLPVVLVTYGASDFVSECLSSLAATGYPNLRVIVVDNDSPDGTVETVKAWAENAHDGAEVPFWENARLPTGQRTSTCEVRRAVACLRVIEAGANRGFAAGVNIGLQTALSDEGVNQVWILNPDAVVEPALPFALILEAETLGRYAVIGSRVVYRDAPHIIQADGGRLHKVCGTAVSVNIGAPVGTAPPAADTLRYIPGVSMLVSRAFVERAGPMPERWFLYFEEVDWQLRRGDLPLGLAVGARVHHSAGASIGSGTVHRGASALSVYFTCRNLMPFVARWAPWKLPFAYAIAYYKLLRQWGLNTANVAAFLRGLHGLSPPPSLRRRLGEDVAKLLHITVFK